MEIFEHDHIFIHDATTLCEKSSKTRSPFLLENQHFFRQINVFNKEVTKELILRKIFESDLVF